MAKMPTQQHARNTHIVLFYFHSLHFFLDTGNNQTSQNSEYSTMEIAAIAKKKRKPEANRAAYICTDAYAVMTNQGVPAQGRHKFRSWRYFCLLE